MKNILSTVAMLLVICLAGIVVWTYVTPSPEPKKVISKALNAEVEIEGMLSPEKQEMIWDAEHVTFEIEHRLGKAFLKAWVKNDAEKLASLFKDGFEAGVPGSTEWQTVTKPPLEQRTRDTTAEDQVATGDTGDVLSLLLTPIKEIEIKKKKLRVLKIRRLDDKQWACRFLLAGSGPDEASNVRLFQSEHEVVVEVVDEKKLADAASIVSWEFRKEIIRDCNAPIMHEITDALELDKVRLADNWILGKGLAKQHNCQVAVEDFDLDHDLDISIMGMDGSRTILAYEDGKYVDVTQELGVEVS
ncbi:MAG: hypothetical protein P8J27_13355, partial [Mariniblastus sp.]|nr:hypothetical protein [Mariniblastus sp.]